MKNFVSEANSLNFKLLNNFIESDVSLEKRNKKNEERLELKRNYIILKFQLVLWRNEFYLESDIQREIIYFYSLGWFTVGEKQKIKVILKQRNFIVSNASLKNRNKKNEGYLQMQRYYIILQFQMVLWRREIKDEGR